MVIDEVPAGAARSRLRPALAVAVAVAVAVVLFRERARLESGTDGLAHADRRWLVAAVAGTVLMWWAGTVSQLGSIPARVPVLRLFAVQLGGLFANHVLPAGAGGMTVNVRFLRRIGLSRSAAAGSVGLNLLAGLVCHTALLAAALALAPHSLAAYPRTDPPDWALVVLAGAVPPLALLAWLYRARWRPAVQQLGAVRTPVRATQLWLGSIAVPVLHCLVLYAVLHAVGGTAGVLPVAVAYLLASSASALLPSPGGFGSLDVALVAALVAVGEPAALALAAVLAYRLITVWIPLLPGACVLAVLIRRRVI
jgi:uncharacterized membrane protein YbhN (UPF0104 family)